MTQAFSCDCWVLPPEHTAEKKLIWAKNSDRHPGESQVLEFHPARVEKETTLGGLTIPGAATLATLGSAPYWGYGYEMGVNSNGVAIGNEAIYTRNSRADSAAGLTGMELVRLGLERGSTAPEAAEVIVGLVERYGQGASATPFEPPEHGYYDNAFLVADPKEALIIEAVGREAKVQAVSSSGYSISNFPPLGSRPDWRKGPTISGAYRSRLTRQALKQPRPLELNQVFALARKHGFGHGVCMHPIPGLVPYQTVASMVAVLPTSSEQILEVWWCAGLPCRGVYLPFFPQTGHLPEIVSRPGTSGRKSGPAELALGDQFEANSYWWLTQKYPETQARNKLEAELLAERPQVLAEAQSLMQKGRLARVRELLNSFSNRALERALALYRENSALNSDYLSKP